jgi:ABC-type lipoprotein release transport system permease subunit
MLFGVQPLDTLTFVAVSGVLTLVALLSCLRPALRATRLDPMHVIREQ